MSPFSQSRQVLVSAKNLTSKLGKTAGIIEFAKDEQAGLGCDPGAVELQLEAVVELDPKTEQTITATAAEETR